MTDYFVDYTAFVDERKRPENFPKQVHVINILNNVQSTEQLRTFINNSFTNMVTSAGLVCMKDPNAIVEQNMVTFDKRFFVPWHMLTHLIVDVKLLIHPVEENPHAVIAPIEPEITPTVPN
jgi:hypothetical protein